MQDIVEVLDLAPVLEEAGMSGRDAGFEALFSELVAAGTHPHLVSAIERKVFEYFADMVLPDEPTLYDHLVLSLRQKDVIATFNWDPFLVQALRRIGTRLGIRERRLPNILFLHGNVAVGHCVGHKPIRVGLRGSSCPTCESKFLDSRLLYPVAQKDYNSDPFIAKSWEALRHSLKDAYLVTLFGYSAPATDVEAVRLIREAWGDTSERKFEEIEIIDVKDEDTLCETWKPLIYEAHYEVTDSFYDSIIGHSPRRSCEATWMCLIEARFLDSNTIPRDGGWDALPSVGRFVCPLLQDERDHERRASP
jgi:hypothetical protein